MNAGSCLEARSHLSSVCLVFSKRLNAFRNPVCRKEEGGRVCVCRGGGGRRECVGGGESPQLGTPLLSGYAVMFSVCPPLDFERFGIHVRWTNV